MIDSFLISKTASCEQNFSIQFTVPILLSREFIYSSIRSINGNHSSNVSLFHVSGKCSPKCVERTVEWDAFSSEYIMLLKTTAHIFIWIGRSCEESEKLNGLKFAKRFHDEGKNLELVVVNDGYEQSLNQHRKADWCTYLPLSSRRVKPLGKLIENPSTSIIKLYQCGLVGGKYRIEEKKSSGVNQSDFNDKNSTFIVDCAKKGVWIWLGRCCSTGDKSEAMRNARGFVRKVRESIFSSNRKKTNFFFPSFNFHYRNNIHRMCR